MKFALPARKPVRENIIPLINIVFLLLIFFMIAGHIERKSPVQPPVSESRVSEAIMEDILYLHADGNISWRNKIYTLEAFRTEISDEKILAEGDKLMIRADQNRMANDFLLVLEVLRSKGVRDVRLITRQDFKK
ncbi:MAG: biopolymer transporter ExbD [Emcibacter sp.]|nr:biopolymer transporter ExbD [Emcibacter sp.]